MADRYDFDRLTVTSETTSEELQDALERSLQLVKARKALAELPEVSEDPVERQVEAFRAQLDAGPDSLWAADGDPED
jgi:hypothetical protein